MSAVESPRTQSGGNFDCSSGSYHTPSLPFYFYTGHTFGRLNQNPFHLLRRKGGVRFQHASHYGRDDGGGERGSVNVLVMLVDDVAFPKLDSDQLPQQRYR